MSRTSNICTAALEGQTIPPDGYIMIGAMWGDVGNWYMASIDECGFNTHPGFQGVRRTAPG